MVFSAILVLTFASIGTRQTIGMGKGRFLKAAERACARKARFETAASAEAFSNYRYRAYRCPVCHHFHLTSRSGQSSPRIDPPPTVEPGPKLGDLDWSNALDPKDESESKPLYQPSSPKKDNLFATCAALPRKDHRALIVLNGRLLKTAKMEDPILIKRLRIGSVVEVSAQAPHKIVKIVGEAGS
jgi:hypothetical protein